MIVVCSSLRAIVHKFPNIFVHDSYTIRHRLSVDQSDYKKCYGYLKIY